MMFVWGYACEREKQKQAKKKCTKIQQSITSTAHDSILFIYLF